MPLCVIILKTYLHDCGSGLFLLWEVTVFNYFAQLEFMKCWAMGWMIRGFESWQRLGIFLLTTMSRLSLVPTQPLNQGIPGALSLGVKQLRHEADHTPPSSAKVKNAWSCTSPLPQYAFMAWCSVKAQRPLP
jgi:hypothetical protein